MATNNNNFLNLGNDFIFQRRNNHLLPSIGDHEESKHLSDSSSDGGFDIHDFDDLLYPDY